MSEATEFKPKDGAYAARVRASFALQGAMGTWALARGRSARPRRIELAMGRGGASSTVFTCRHGGTALDSACGYAASRLMRKAPVVLTIEFKITCWRRPKASAFRMVGQGQPGRTITVTEGRAYAIDGGHEKLIATLGATLMTITGRDNIKN